MDELLTIGEFSRSCGLSARVLRSYAGNGLLPPAAVDRWTGYRYYAPVQLQQAEVIGLLRQAGMSLRDIASLLADPGPARLDDWERSLGRELASRRQALAAARHRLATLTPDPPPPADLPPAADGFIAGTASAQGAARAVNQDTALAADGLLAVADGLGAAGQTASLLAVEVLLAAVTAGAGPARACQAANAAIWRHTGDDAEPTMGATLTAVVSAPAAPGSARSLVHVGDSRAYQLHSHPNGHRLSRLTEDHTLMADLVRTGQLSEDDARRHPQRALLTRALGTSPRVEPFVTTVRLAAGDRLLLCTDGVTSVLTDEQIAAALADPGPPREVAAGLVQLALTHGSQDDTSVVVADPAAADPAATDPASADDAG